MDHQLQQFCKNLGPSREALSAWQVQNLRQGVGTRPAVDVVLFGEKQVVYKNYVAAAPVFARFLGPLLTWRECRSLQRLDSLSGIPGLLMQIGKRGLVMEKIDAVPVLKADFDVDWAAFFQAYTQLLDEMHGLGVAHGDLRSPHNTLVDRQGHPYIVDFVASVHRGRIWNWPANRLFHRIVMVDRSAVLKLKNRLAPELLRAEDQSALDQSTRFGCMARGFGQGVRKLSRILFTAGK